MKTEPTPVSGVAAFLGETASPEATTTVTFTGTQKSVAKAIAGMAKKPAKKPAMPSTPPVEDDLPPPPEDEMEVDVAPEGEEIELPIRGPRDESRVAKAADIVESLIQEQPAAPK